MRELARWLGRVYDDRMNETACSGCGRESRPGDGITMLGARAPGVFLSVCRACVDECVAAIADAPTRIPGRNRACSFCSTPETNVAVLLMLGQELICDECVEAYRRDR